jgi:hypothetical protein
VAVLAQEAISVNAVGYTKVDIASSNYALMCLGFESFTNADINTLVGNQLPANSAAWIWDRTGDTYVTEVKMSRGGWPNPGRTIYRGDAFWLFNAGAVTNSVVIPGEVPSESRGITNTVVYDVDGLNALSYPFPGPVFWTNTSLAIDAAADDALWIWSVTGQTYVSHIKMSRGGWTTAGGVEIEPGVAFWFKSNSTTNWDVPKPYTIY